MATYIYAAYVYGRFSGVLNITGIPSGEVFGANYIPNNPQTRNISGIAPGECGSSWVGLGTNNPIAWVANHTSSALGAGGAGNTVLPITASIVPANHLLVVWTGFDNASTTTPTVTSVSKPGTETASWVKIAEHNASSNTSNAAVRGEMWAIYTTVEWPAATTATVLLSESKTARCAVLAEFSGAGTSLRGTSGAGTSTSGVPTSTTAGTAPLTGDLVLGGATFEMNTAATDDADTSNGSWSAGNKTNVAQGGSAANSSVILQYKIVTGGGNQTYNPTGGSDSGSCVTALKPTVTIFWSLSPASIASGEVFGTPAVSVQAPAGPTPQTVNITGIATGEVLGTPTVLVAQTVTATGIATAAALGTATVTSAITLTMTGIATGVALGTSTVTATYTLTATGIATAVALGTSTVTATYTLTTTGIATGAALGTATVTSNYPLTVTGIATAVALGTAAVLVNQAVTITGIATGEAFGTAGVSAGTAPPQTVTATGIATAEALGTAVITTTYTLTTTGIATGAALGTAVVTSAITLTMTGIATAEAFGTATVTSMVTVTVTGIATGETWRQTEPYTRWFGQGVAEGTLLTTSVVGAGDDAFTSIGGASSQAVVSNTDIQFTYTTGNSTAQWFFTPTNWHMARCDLVVPPTGMATSLQIARLMDTAGNALSGVTLTGAGVGVGKVRIVRPDTTTHLESTWQLVQGTRYVMQILCGPNGATNHFRVNFYDHATGALFNSLSTTTLPLGTGSQQPGRVYFGAWFYATSGQSITMGDFAHQDTDGTNLNDEIQWITTVSSNYTVTCTGIPTGEAFGTASTGIPPQTVTATSIATGEAHGTAVVLGGLHPYIASTTSTAPGGAGGATSLVITVPDGMQIGDMMLVALAAQNSVATADFTNTGPTFTRIGLPFVSSDTTVRVLGWFAHVFTATPPSTVTFTAPNATFTRLAGVAMRVLNAGIPVAAQAADYGKGGITPTGSTATVPHDGCLALFSSTINVTTTNSGDVATPPSGMTLVASVLAGGGAGSGTHLHVYKQQYETGTTDSKTFTFVGPSIAQSSTNLMVLEGGKVSVTGIASGEAFGTSICRFLPAVETFIETFDSVVSSTTWPTVENGGAVWEAGRAKLTNSLAPGYVSSLTGFAYDLRNSSCFVRVTPHTAAILEMETVFSVYNASDEGGAIIISGSPRTMHIRKREGVSVSDINVSYDPEAERWWKIQLVGNTMDYLTSPDGVFWTSRRTVTYTTADFSTVRVRMRCGNYGTTAGIGIAYFDNFNVVVAEDVAGIWNGTAYRPDSEIWNGLSWQPQAQVWNGTSWALL